MRDISARELKGHNILAVERFWDNTRWMIEFSVLRPSTAYGGPGDEMRLLLTEDGYQAALQSQQRARAARDSAFLPGFALLRATSATFSTSYARFESASLSYCLTVASHSMPTPQLFCSQ